MQGECAPIDINVSYAVAPETTSRGTSLIRNSPPLQDQHTALGIVLL